MTPTKILIGQIALVFGVVLAGVWFGTQFAASELGYAAELGAPWFSLGATPVYKPWRLFEWWYAYEAYAPAIFARAGAIAAAGGVAGAAVAIAGSVWRARSAKNVTTYGSARWARVSEIAKAGLFAPAGVVLGRYRDRYLRHNGPEHVMAFAPTRSGKGVGLVVPTLLTWRDSALIHDIKGENWELTAGWRSSFSRCLRFDPTDPKSARYNPLLEVRRGPNEIRDVQNISDILVDPDGALEHRNHWQKTAQDVLEGAILHVLYAEDEKTLSRVATLLSDPDRPILETIAVMARTPHLGSRGVHPKVAKAARALENKSPNELSGVLSTVMTYLGLYADPVVERATAQSDFRIEDLVTGERPLSLYLAVPPSDISRTRPLVRLMLNQIGRRLTERLDLERRRLLMMLDEFPTLGRLDFFETALAFLGGYGVRAFLIAQSLNQIEKAYGPNNAILDNCHVRVAFATNDERTAKRISDGLGTATEMRAQRNYAGHRLAPWLAHVMVSRQETARPLMTPGEVMQLDARDELVMVAGSPPIRAGKLRYYEDRNFLDRRLDPPADASDGAPVADHDWSDLTITAAPAHEGDRPDFDEDDGGLRQARAPEREPDATVAPERESDVAAIPEAGDGDAPRDARTLKQLTPVQRAHGLNAGASRDPIEEF